MKAFSAIPFIALLTSCNNGNVYGPLPDAATALRAGCAVIHTHFPKGDPDCGPGFSAELEGNVWTVGAILPDGYVGGGPVVKLSKADGRVLDFYLTQ